MHPATTYRRRKYRTDPEYRKRKLADTARARGKVIHDPAFQRLDDIHKRIYSARGSYELHSSQAEQWFARLEKLLAMRERLRAEYRSRKRSGRIGEPLEWAAEADALLVNRMTRRGEHRRRARDGKMKAAGEAAGEKA